MKKVSYILLIFISFFILSCKNEDENVSNLSHQNTYKDGESGFRLYINDELFEGDVYITNSLDIDKTLPLSFGLVTDFNFAAFNWLPNKVGTYRGGHNVGVGQSSMGNDMFFNGHIKYKNELYYFFSNSPYAHSESSRVSGSSFTFRLSKLDGGYKRYRFMNITITGFIGVAAGEFSGTLVNNKGDKIEIKRGEFRSEYELPNGAEVLD
jgi:hypothetical protein